MTSDGRIYKLRLTYHLRLSVGHMLHIRGLFLHMPLTRLPLSYPEALPETLLSGLNGLSYLAGALLPLPPPPS